MLQTPALIFCAVDSLLPQRGKMLAGFDDFSAALEHAAIPLIWVTNRTRLQIDEPRRTLGHNHPFIAEGGSGVYLPEGYFHLRPAKTLRFGRFTCLPVGEPQPAAAEALEELSSETGVPVVALRTLAPRELAHNSGLPVQQAELLRHRDFDELFFFAGASQTDIERFIEEGRQQKRELRPRDVFWSLAIGANLKQCVNELSKLYARALRSRPKIVGIAGEDSDQLLNACDRGFHLKAGSTRSPGTPGRFREIDQDARDVWERILEAMDVKT